MSFEDHQGPFSLDDEVEALSEERQFIALQRAMKRLGMTIDEHPIPDEDDEEFKIVFADELKRMVITDITTEMMRKGLIEPARVDEEGEIYWTITDEGKQAIGIEDEDEPL